MGQNIISNLVTIAVAIVGISIVATLVSNGANTSKVITAATGGFATVLKDAVSPVTGGSTLGSIPSIN